MSASLPSEELPRRIAREVADELRGRREMDAADMRAEMQDFPLPLVGLVNIPISNLDNYPPGELASASGKTDGQQQATALPEQARRGT
jgi:hypothetical protein